MVEKPVLDQNKALLDCRLYMAVGPSSFVLLEFYLIK